MSPRDAGSYRLSFTLDGPEVAYDDFVQAARAWNTLLRSVDRGVAGGQPNVTWVVETISKASPLRVELVAVPARSEVRAADVKKTVRAVVQGVRTIQRRAKRPEFFSDRALASAKEIAELHDRNVTVIKVENGQASVEITKRLSANVDELIGPKTSSEGTVEGTLEVVSIHGKTEFFLFESLTGNRVACYFPPEQLEQVMSAFGRRVAASGEIFANAAGKRLHVRVDSFEPFPSEEQLPTIEEMIGLFGDVE